MSEPQPVPGRIAGTPRRRLALLAVILLIAVAAARLLPAMLRPHDRAWERIQRHGRLRVGMDATYPPFEVVDAEGRFSGYDVDLAEALATRWGVEVEFVNVHFDGLYDALRTERFELIISALPYERTLTRDLLYSPPYFDAGQVLLLPAGRTVEDVADLAGQAVAVELGAEAHQLLRYLSLQGELDIEIVAVHEREHLYEPLHDGRAAAIACDRLTAYALQNVDPGLEIALALTKEPLVIAALPESRELMAEVQVALEEWRRDGTIERLEERWLRGAASLP